MKHVKFQQTFICEFYDKQEAVLISWFTSYIGQKNKNLQPLLKSHLDQNVLDSLRSFYLLTFAAVFHFF